MRVRVDQAPGQAPPHWAAARAPGLSPIPLRAMSSTALRSATPFRFGLRPSLHSRYASFRSGQRPPLGGRPLLQPPLRYDRTSSPVAAGWVGADGAPVRPAALLRARRDCTYPAAGTGFGLILSR